MRILIIRLVSIIFLISLLWKKGKGIEIKENKDKADEDKANNLLPEKDKYKFAEKDEKVYKKRMRWLYWYLIFGIFLCYIIFVFKERLDENIAKILFCIGSTSLGAFICGYNYRITSKNHPFPKYSLYYPIILLILAFFASVLTSIILKAVNISDNAIFYFLALFIGSYCGQYIDNPKILGDKVKK